MFIVYGEFFINYSNKVLEKNKRNEVITYIYSGWPGHHFTCSPYISTASLVYFSFFLPFSIAGIIIIILSYIYMFTFISALLIDAYNCVAFHSEDKSHDTWKAVVALWRSQVPLIRGNSIIMQLACTCLKSMQKKSISSRRKREWVDYETLPVDDSHYKGVVTESLCSWKAVMCTPLHEIE